MTGKTQLKEVWPNLEVFFMGVLILTLIAANINNFCPLAPLIM